MRIAKEVIAALSLQGLTDMHTCVCYLRLAELFEKAESTEYINYLELKQYLQQYISKMIEKDISKWSGYFCRPSHFIFSKNSEYYLEHKKIADYECKHIIKTQLVDGSWNVPWTWNDYPEEWAVSKNWWKGHIIIQNLLYLKRFGLI